MKICNKNGLIYFVNEYFSLKKNGYLNISNKFFELIQFLNEFGQNTYQFYNIF